MDDLLAYVERPSQYLGNELNAVKKDLDHVDLTVGLAYPDLYEIGMSNTGLHILYHMLNENPEVSAERVYLPADDMLALLERDQRSLATLENRIPLGELDVLGIQIPHELSYANIVKTLRLGQIPIWTKDRGREAPLILGGGPGAFGPEVVAPFYDAILLGDGEEAFWEILQVVKSWRDDSSAPPRSALHQALAKVTGVYVPALYEIDYSEDGVVQEIRSLHPDAPQRVFKAVLDDLETAYFPETAIVPYSTTVHDRLGVEVMRGCTVGCRFCQAGMIYRPLRERSPKQILDLAKCGLGSTGFEDVSLLSLDTGDYTLIDPLTKELLAQTEDQRVSLSLPSLRAGSLTDDVIRDIRRVRRTSFTIAPEAGTQRLRDVINKNISDEEIFETVERVSKNGWTGLKLYFMVGFPTETQEDLDGLIALVLKCREIGRHHKRSFNCMASIGTLVPKPQTPFQWDPQISREESKRRMWYVTHELRSKGVGCKFHDPEHSWLEGVLTRADRRLAPVIVDAESRGAGFESWQNKLDTELWAEVFSDHGIDPEWYLRQRDYKEVLPWDHLSARVTKKYLLGDRKKIDRLASPTTFDCRDDLCSGCAVCFDDDTRNRLAKYHPDPFGDGRQLPPELVSRVAVGHGVARTLEQQAEQQAQDQGASVRDQAAKAGADALAAKLRRRRPAKPGKRRLAVTPGAPGSAGIAPAFEPEVIAEEGELQLEDLLAPPPSSESDPPPLLTDQERQAQENSIYDKGGRAPNYHYLVTYQRLGDLRWLAHKEVVRTVYRALSRTRLPILYTRGFHPKAKLAFSAPLPVGAESYEEELDIWLAKEWDAAEVEALLRREFPTRETPEGLEGLPVKAVRRVKTKRAALSMRAGARWSIGLRSLGVSEEDAAKALAEFRARETFPLDVVRTKRGAKGSIRHVDLKELVKEPTLRSGCLELNLLVPTEGSAKPALVVATLFGIDIDQAKRGRYLLIEVLRREPAPALPVVEPVVESPAAESSTPEPAAEAVCPAE
jgi:radical SAM family uncharacterized protein/radical SAM-linked protein